MRVAMVFVSLHILQILLRLEVYFGILPSFETSSNCTVISILKYILHIGGILVNHTFSAREAAVF